MFDAAARRRFETAALSRGTIFLFALVMVHMAVTFGIQAYYGLSPENGVFRILLSRLSLFLPIFFVIVLLWNGLQTSGTNRAAGGLRQRFALYIADRAAVTESVISLCLIVVFLGNFSRFKGIIPLVNPFSWDEKLAALDRFVHGGLDPWQWMWPLLQHSFVIRSLDVAYFVWFLVVYFAIFLAIFGRGHTHSRRAFLIGTVLVWGLGGNIIATLFSSAGPVFYENLGLGPQFAPLTQHLAQINAAQTLMASSAKDIIWQGYAHGGDITSISAFPSIHLASTALVTLFAFSFSRLAGWIMIAFTAVIFVGSVGLAWHYALDGYAGMLIAYASWRAGLRIAARA